MLLYHETADMIQETVTATEETRDISKVRFVTNFEYVPQALTPICPYHQKENAPKIISIICEN